MTKRQRWAVVRDAGHTGASLALRIGASKSTVCRLLNGTQVTRETAEAVAKELGRTAEGMWPRGLPRRAAA